MKIRTKLILANLFIVLFLLGSVTYVLVQRSSALVYERVIENASLSLSQVANNLDNKLESYELIPNTLFLNNTIDGILETRYADYKDAYDDYAEYYFPFISAVRTTRDVAHLNLYTTNDTFLFGDILLIDADVKKSDWYPKVIGGKSGGYWTGPYSIIGENQQVISYRKRLNNYVNDSLKIVSLEIKQQVLYDLISEEGKSKRYLFALSDGTVMMDSDRSRPKPLAKLQDLPFFSKIEGLDGSFRYEMDGELYEIVYKSLGSRNVVKGMKVLTFIPVTQLQPKLEQLRSLAILLFLIAFVISGLLISAISVGMTRRLSELASKMKRIHKDNFQSFVEVRGKDEVAQLGEMFNVMVRRVGTLIQEVYQSEIDRKGQELRTKEVELYALQTQINPHFLFNVLNMIRGKLLIVGERDTAKVVGLLAKSFRMMLKSGGQTVALSEELEFVDSYLQIQQYRFGHKFTYRIDVPDEARDARLPKLSLQPLVENAITHGIELSPNACRIWIEGEVVSGELRLVVGDDGLGMTPERLAEVERSLAEDALSSDSHIGLRNVHARLIARYGEDNGLKIASEPGAGVTVRLVVPLTYRVEGEHDV
ncbi:Sensor histidine kinase YesM [Cohnella sp. OV330]|uniref:cache domain-containing sensor histidine kinase n=1 Tax=Cohnella sp. OV330 TaxID=1855288 RepID=UPI0008E1421F|nr:sensor histidine kinase [Cohnella sp. OV330]SFB27271.1 Sensor histidine kinase YesM [Cohnella sp. OV330]